MTTETEKINWLAILRGLTITLVVMNHVQLLDPATGGNYEFIDAINSWFVHLRIPTFVMVSGALLYYTRITKGWDTLSVYKDKLVRIGLPLLFCTILGTLMQLLFNSFVKTPHNVTITSFLSSFVLIKGNPWPHRWYLMSLLTMMALYPVYKNLSKKWAEILLLIGLFCLQKVDFTHMVSNNWFYIFSLNKYLPFFYLGILSFKYDMWSRIKQYKYYAAPISVLAYAGLVVLNEYVPFNEYAPICELSGIVAAASTCMVIDSFAPRLFGTYRNYIFQIYLFGIAFQAFVELILWRALGYPGSLVIPFYILNILAGIYLPVVMSKVVELIPIKFIRLCFGLK